MSTKSKIILGSVIGLIVLSITAGYLSTTNIPVLQPRGEIGAEQLKLIIFACVLSLIIIVPVFGMLFMFTYKYRESNTKAKYSPNWDGNKLLETIWWTVPALLIIIISSVIWTSSYALDPYKELSSPNKPIEIQVIALDWKWLFIYPEQNIATVNYFKIPKDVPVHFNITSDAPMNSFWVPQLGSQIYAMPGMSTTLHLMANSTGNFHGSSANISGRGFSGMTFVASASTQSDFDKWVSSVQKCGNSLTSAEYLKLAKPSQNNHVQLFGNVDHRIYQNSIDKFMMPVDAEQSTMSSMGMDMEMHQ